MIKLIYLYFLTYLKMADIEYKPFKEREEPSFKEREEPLKANQRIYTVKKWDTWRTIIKKLFWIENDIDINNKIIEISKMNEGGIKKSISVFDWSPLQDTLLPHWQEIIVEIKNKWLSKRQKLEEILGNIPTPQDFLSSLEINHPTLHERLLAEFKRLQKPDLPWYRTIEEYLKEQIKPLYYSQEQYKGFGGNVALTSEWLLVQCSEVWRNPSDFKDRKFMWYGIYWRKKVNWE